MLWLFQHHYCISSTIVASSIAAVHAFSCIFRTWKDNKEEKNVCVGGTIFQISSDLILSWSNEEEMNANDMIFDVPF